MNINITPFWAKKENGFWLTLYQHSLDTRYIIKRLYEEWFQYKTLVNSHFTDADAKSILEFIAATHDLGKLTPQFQHQEIRYESDVAIYNNLNNNGFKSISNKHIRHELFSELILLNNEIDPSIAAIVGSHHGMPQYNRTIATNRIYINDLPNNWKIAQKDMINRVAQNLKFNYKQHIPQEIANIFAGLLIMADWIASNTDYFPLLTIGDFKINPNRYESGYLSWKQDNPINTWEPEQLSIFNFKNLFGFSPNAVQTKVLELDVSEPNVYILEAPMGIGKTEAALALANNIANQQGQTGIFFGLPTQATSNAVFKRLSNWLNTGYPNAHLRLKHSNAELNDNYSKIKENTDPGQISVNPWFAGSKRSMLEDFVVGTVDQAITISRSQNHLSLKHLALSQKVIIIDEVHAYDAFMQASLYRALEWFGALKIPVIILSATLPTKTRKELLQSYLKGKSQNSEQITLIESTAYPKLSFTQNSEIVEILDFNTSQMQSTNVSISHLSEDRLIASLKYQLQNGGYAGIIVNTIQHAQDLYDIISKIYPTKLLHARFLAPERIRIEQEFENELSNNPNHTTARVYIGTQVMEQSLDLDFDILYSEIAPIDLFLQRIGRLHRHSNTIRPNNLVLPQAIILRTDADNYGKSENIYGSYLLRATMKTLKDVIHLPQDIPILVNHVYTTNNYPELETEFREYCYDNLEKFNKPRNYLISSPKSNATLHLDYWMRNLQQTESDNGVATVRDIDPQFEVVLLKKVNNIFTNIISNKPYLGGDFSIGQEIAKQSINLPNQVSNSRNYDLTKEFLDIQQTQLLPEWKINTWLKFKHFLILDKNNSISMPNINKFLIYSIEKGLMIFDIS